MRPRATRRIDFTPRSTCRLSSGSESSSWAPDDLSADRGEVQNDRTRARRKWSCMAFWTMRWNTSGSSERASPVFFRKLEHGLLHDVQSGVRVAHGIKRLLVRSPLDFSEEIGQFLAGSQLCLPYPESRPGTAAARTGRRQVRFFGSPGRAGDVSKCPLREPRRAPTGR